MSDEDTMVEEPEVEAPEVEESGEPVEGGGPDEWTAVFGDEHDDLRDKYGGDPAAVLKAYRDQNSSATQMAQELAEFRQYAAEREEWDRQFEQGGGHAPAGGPEQGFDVEALIRQAGSLFDEGGEIDAAKLGAILNVYGSAQTQMIAQAVQEALEHRFGEFEKTKVAPLASKLASEEQAAEIARLEDTFGDRFDAVTAEAQKMRGDHPDLSVTALYGLASAALDSRAANRRRLEAEGFTLDSKGRPAAPKPRLSADELELQAQEMVGRAKRSMI